MTEVVISNPDQINVDCKIKIYYESTIDDIKTWYCRVVDWNNLVDDSFFIPNSTCIGQIKVYVKDTKDSMIKFTFNINDKNATLNISFHKGTYQHFVRVNGLANTFSQSTTAEKTWCHTILFFLCGGCFVCGDMERDIASGF